MAVNVAARDGQPPVVAWITHDDVIVAELDLDTARLVDERTVDGHITPIAHPIERPAVAVYPDGSVDVAFTSFQAEGASVFLSRDAAAPQAISGTPRHETNLVHMTVDSNGLPILTWLEEATLSVARSGDDDLEETESVDDSEVIHMFWETQGQDGGLSYAWSDDVGVSFSEPVLLVDRDMIDGGAPRSPSVVFDDDHLVATWADARRGYVAAWPTTR